MTLAHPADGRRSHRLAPPVVLAVAAAVLTAATLCSLAVGSRPIPVGDVWRVLLQPDGSVIASIVHDLRLPRAVVAVLVGGALAVAGAQLQGLTGNPLADPGLLGVSAGAALGVVTTSTVLGLGGAVGRSVAALLGALAATAAVFALAGGAGRRSSPVGLALAGVALTMVLGSLTTVVVLADADTLEEYRFWAVGSVAGRPLHLLWAVLPLLALGGLLAAATARALDLVALGEDAARGLGVRVRGHRIAVVASATLLTAGAVAVAGPLTFVGLLVPHLARPLVGASHRWLLPGCALLGALLVLAADVAGRVIAPPGEVAAGVVTAFLGAPFLVLLVRWARRSRTELR